MSTTRQRRKPTSARTAPLRPALGIEARDFDTLPFAIIADDLRNGIPRDPIDVVFYFAKSIEAGYLPPDELLRWLGEKFAGYLAGGPKAARLDECLGLAPKGRGRREARTIAAGAVMDDAYMARLALLDHAGLSPKAAVLSLNDGVKGALEPIAQRGRRAESSLATLAPKWRRSKRYAWHRELLRDAGERLPSVAALCAHVKMKSQK